MSRVVAGRLDALIVVSPDAAEDLLLRAGGADRRGALLEAARGPLAVAVLDPATARALERSGIPITVMPPEPRTAGLIRALDAWAARRADGLAPALRDRRWPVELCPDAQVARIGARSVVLGELEFRVLAAMVRRPAVTCRHELLLREAWGPGAPDDPTRVKHQISRIRQKLGPARDCIETVRGIGYRYAPGRGPTVARVDR